MVADSMTSNLFPPWSSSTGRPAHVVDRRLRDQLALLIRRFLAEELTSFGFDDLLDEYRDSADSAVRFVANEVWCYCDDFEDHLVALSKPAWDYFQRLLLLLESDRAVETTHWWRWSWTQLVALGALLGFVQIALSLGWGEHLLIYAIPFGIISIAISRLRRSTNVVGPYHRIIHPFATISDLKAVYDAVGFKKARCPRNVQARRIHSPLGKAGIHLHLYSHWLIHSPIALAFQLLPERKSRLRVVVA